MHASNLTSSSFFLPSTGVKNFAPSILSSLSISLLVSSRLFSSPQLSMPTALVRSLKAFRPQQLNFLQSCKARLDHFINVQAVCWPELAVPHVEQHFTANGRKVGFTFVSFSLSPPPDGKQAATYFFSLSNRFISPAEDSFVLKMGERKVDVSIEENLKKGAENATVPEGEMVRLQKEQEKRKEEEERNRVKEQRIEDKIGPPPEKPLAGDCCGQGCEVCIWDTYWEELDEYKKLRKAAEEESG